MPTARPLELTRCVAALALAASACGPSAPPPAAPSAPSASSPPPEIPAKTVRFTLGLDGKPIGEEVWSVRLSPDGAETIDFEDHVVGPRGKLHGKGRLAIDSAHLPGAADVSIDTPDEGSATFHLARTGQDLTLTMSHGGSSDQLKAGKPSNLFVPRPFFVGLAPVCALLAQKEPPPLVEFPGSNVTVVSKKSAAGAVAFVLDHDGLGRTIVACEGTDLVAVVDPWGGQSAVRSDRAEVGQALTQAAERAKPATPADLTEEDMSVEVPAASGDAQATLACSFLRPSAARGKLPAVVFSTGSGPQDRDEDSIGRGGMKLSVFKEMAIALAEKGVASLRCDDRGTAKSTGSFEKATLGTFVRDALETVAALAKRKEIDPTRLGFVGHSEGAVVGPLVAAKSKAPGAKIRALLLMASPGRPLPEIGMAQEEAFLQRSGLPADQVQRQLEAQRAVLEAIRTGKPLPEDIPAQHREAIEKQRAWLKSHFDNDLLGALRQVPKMPILIAQGGKDIQIPPDDADRVRTALAAGKNPDARVKVYSELNHAFAVGHGGGVTEYADADAHVDAAFLADTVEFFTRALAR